MQISVKKLYKKILVLLSIPEYFFLCTASLFGILFLLVIPPFQTPDENVHFYRAYEVSELGANRIEKDHAMGSMLPSSIAKTEYAVNAEPDVATHIQFNPYNKYHLSYTKKALFHTPLNQNEKSFYRTESYPMFVYIPQAIAVSIGKIFNSPIIVMVYLARIANLLIWVTIVFWCIKYFPWKKWALVGICLLPVVVSQTVSPGLDVLAISSTLVFLIIVFNELCSKAEKFTTKKLLLLICAASIMCLTKATLAIFFPLVFLIKNNQIVFKYKYIAKITTVLLPIILFFIWTITTPTSQDSTQAPFAGQQISIFLHNPFHFIHLLLNTGFFVTIAGNAVAQSMVGDFGWLDTPLGPFITFLVVAYMSFLIFVDITKRKIVISKKTRVVMSVVAIGSVIASFLAMYVYSTLPSDNHIKGVQGRYLIPAMIMLIPIFLNSPIITTKQQFMRIVQVMSVVILALSVLTIIMRYYYVFIPT